MKLLIIHGWTWVLQVPIAMVTSTYCHGYKSLLLLPPPLPLLCLSLCYHTVCTVRCVAIFYQAWLLQCNCALDLPWPNVNICHGYKSLLLLPPHLSLSCRPVCTVQYVLLYSTKHGCYSVLCRHGNYRIIMHTTVPSCILLCRHGDHVHKCIYVIHSWRL